MEIFLDFFHLISFDDFGGKGNPHGIVYARKHGSYFRPNIHKKDSLYFMPMDFPTRT